MHQEVLEAIHFVARSELEDVSADKKTKASHVPVCWGTELLTLLCVGPLPLLNPLHNVVNDRLGRG